MYWFTFAVSIIIIYKILDNFNDISQWFKKHPQKDKDLYLNCTKSIDTLWNPHHQISILKSIWQATQRQLFIQSTLNQTVMLGVIDFCREKFTLRIGWINKFETHHTLIFHIVNPVLVKVFHFELHTLDTATQHLWGYRFGYELLMLNGLLTFLGLWLTKRRIL